MIKNSLFSPTPMMSTRWLQVALLSAASWALQPSAHAQTSWNAYNDFYLSPTAAGWGGATTPSATGNAWGYYAANVNGFGYPTQIGTYMTPTAAGTGTQNMYQYSSVAPIGAGTPVGASGWVGTGGRGFAYYGDTFSWGSSLGSYPTPWFGGAPGASQGLSNLIWMQSGWLGGSASEGIAPVLTWKVPTTGTYTFTGRFVSGDQSANSAAVAVVDSQGGTAPLARTILPNNSATSFSFTKSYTAGDVVQFQVGNNFSAGNAVGLQVDIKYANWNAARDFYFSPSVTGWGGATAPSGAATAWGYYMGNVNGGVGFPTSVGTYLTSGQIYKYTSHNPASSSDGTVYGTTLWDATGGAGFARYQDTLGWGTSLGFFDTPWFSGAPGNTTEARGGIWMQAGKLGPDAEGIASVVTWTAPYAGIYDLKGSFQVGRNGPDIANGASLAIVASTGSALMERTVATQGMDYPFAFRRTMNQGDVIQFQVGTDNKTGSAVGLNADVTRVGDVNQKVPSSVSLAGSPTLAYTGSGVTPALDILGSTTSPTYSYKGVDGTSYGPSSSAPTAQGRYEVTITTADDATWSGTTNKFYYSLGTFNAFKDFWWNRANGKAAWINPSNALAQGRSLGTPTSKNSWNYGLFNCANKTITDSNVNTTFQALPGYSYDTNNTGWTYHNGDTNGTRVSWVATNSNNATLLLAPSAGAASGDGLAAAVRWTAPAAGTYRFLGRFVSQGSDSMSVAIQTFGGDEGNVVENTAYLARTNVAAGATQTFDFINYIEANQTVTWVVGSDGPSTGDVMLLSANVTQVIPSTISSNPTASFITAGQALSNSIISGGSVTPSGGTWAWVNPSNVFSTPGTYSIAAVYTPALADQSFYQNATANLTLVVNSVTPTGPTFAGAYPGKSLSENAPNGLTYLMNYALGGSSTNPTLLPVQDTSDGTKLTLYAFVRTNDSSVTVVGESGASLTNFTNSPVLGVRTTDQTGAPDGTERRAFTVNASGDRLFLRLKASK